MVSQSVVAPLSKAAMFTVMTVNPGSEDAIRDLLAGLADLTKSVSFRRPDDQLDAVVGIGSQLWDRLFSGPRPAHLHPLPAYVGGTHASVSTPGDLLLHLRADRLDVCFELASIVHDKIAGHVKVVDETQGFGYFDRRDLLGFVDGTANPEGDAALEAALIGDEDPEFTGGSYVIVQKYTHDLAAWNAQSIEEQERAIGRSKLTDVEFPDDVKASNSHITLNTVTDDEGEELDIMRYNMPFGSVGEQVFGTYFIAYAKDPSVTETMLQRMFIGVPAGNHDRILDFSTPHTGTLFFVPSPDLLDELESLPAADAGGAARARQEQPQVVTTAADPDAAAGDSTAGDATAGDSAEPAQAADPSSGEPEEAADDSLGIGSLRPSR